MSLRPRWLLLFSTLSALALPTVASAEDAKSGEFSVQRFQPAPGPRNFFTVQGARTDGKMAWSAGLFVNYSNSPFVLRSCKSATDCSAPNPKQPNDIKIVESMVTTDLLGSFTPISRLQIGLRVPLTFVSGSGIDTTTGDASKDKLSGFGVGDPTLEAKVRVLGEANSPFVLGVALFGSGPIGSATAKDKYIGDSSPVVGGRAIADVHTGPVHVLGNLAGLYRGSAKLGTTELGSEFRYGVGLGFDVSPAVMVLAEGFGATKFSSQAGTSSLEIDGGLKIHPLASGLNFFLGGGGGVLQGVGVPAFRGFGGFMYVREAGDSDNDGIPDDVDQCPNEPEDKDGYQDSDGCPDLDNDGDAIPDAADKCPNQPETMNGYQDEDGCPDELPDKDGDGIADSDDMCPDEGGASVIRAKGQYYGCPDRDKDGVPDKLDKCPDEPEDTDGFQDEDGCPDPDNDGDGVPDTEDECGDQPGSKENRGCPDPDTDGDGIPDSKDQCKDKPETYNGYKDEDGCPDTSPGLIEVSDDKIKIKDQVQFATNSDKIVGAKSFLILDQVASVLLNNKAILLLEVGGHTDNVGGADQNKSLSQRRAEAVMKYLVEKKGVDAGKLKAVGYGQEKPIADNKSTKGRQENRRVEFNILRSQKKGAGAAPAPAPAAPPEAKP